MLMNVLEHVLYHFLQNLQNWLTKQSITNITTYQIQLEGTAKNIIKHDHLLTKEGL